MFEPLYEGAHITVCGAYCALMELKRVCRLPFHSYRYAALDSAITLSTRKQTPSISIHFEEILPEIQLQVNQIAILWQLQSTATRETAQVQQCTLPD